MNEEQTTIVQYANALAFAQQCSMREAKTLIREIMENHLVWVYVYGEKKEHLISYVKMIDGAIHIYLKDNKSKKEDDRILTLQMQEMEFWDK